MERRAFLSQVGRFGAGSCAACVLGGLAPRAGADVDEPTWTRQIDYYERLPDNKVQCFVCPVHCILADGETCLCRTRTNVGGRLFTRAYSNPCILRVDPIEKIPLAHFRPGSKTMTVATGGCNLRCLYCQNWQHSQHRPDELDTFDLSPADAVAAAKRRSVDTIAFNYTEPVASLEYATDIARLAKEAGLRVVAATGAFVEPEPLLGLAKHLDALTIGLKGFTEEFYSTVCGIHLDPVLKAIETIHTRTECWLELVNLIVPTYNDDLKTIRRMCGWVRRTVGVNVPLHFSRFVPMYRLANLPKTPVTTLEAAHGIARDIGLRHVYLANIAPHDANNTYCPKCRASLVQRLGLKVLDQRIEKDRCPACRTRIPGVWS